MGVVVLFWADNVGFGVSEVGALVDVEFVDLDLMILITLMLCHWNVAHGLSNGLLLQ